MKKEDIEFWRDISYQIITEVGEAVSPLVGKEKSGKTVKMGADGTPTKMIDVVAEEKVIEILKNTGKSVTLISEEIGEFKIGEGPSEVVFVVDPLDGTINALKNIPFYGISIAIADLSIKSLALLTLHDIEIGFVKNLASGDLYEAVKGKGASLNGEGVIPSSQVDITGSLIGAYVRGAMTKMNEICKTVRRIRLLGSVATELCYVADGTYDAFLDIRGNLRVVDIAAAKLIVEEAGGTVTNEHGKSLDNKLDVTERTSIIAACNLNIHKDIINTTEVL
ncbi:bifunctional fructose-bisphosphatase/inositol-phosphate phosphatase [Methanobacterium sp.]|uniref:bifunctional fructose-bisphosphatase/inositol-phosphate phosphatase n=1 Tax=Methanobacterium sp. TaxID=2164 RepID=UPI003C74DDA3